jgi:hypothetical protein
MHEQTERDMRRQLIELAQKVIGAFRALVPDIGPLIYKIPVTARRQSSQTPRLLPKNLFCPQKLDDTHAERARKLLSTDSTSNLAEF